MSETRPKIEIYTDGGADPNPGPGGWAAILLHPKTEPKELSGGEEKTTNNRMELTAAIKALEALDQPYEIQFHTDSQYLRNGITSWIEGWKMKRWAGVLNADLWQRLDRLVEPHEIDWIWVKGHAGNKYNERADELATAAMPRKIIEIDKDATQVYLRLAGSAEYSTGPSGWAAAVVRGEKVEVISGGHEHISPNHLALYAALETLKLIPENEPLQFFTNHSYLFDGITNWVNGWRAGNWQKDIKFKEDWQRLDQLNRSRKIQWVKMKDTPEYFKMLEAIAEQERSNIT